MVLRNHTPVALARSLVDHTSILTVGQFTHGRAEGSRIHSLECPLNVPVSRLFTKQSQLVRAQPSFLDSTDFAENKLILQKNIIPIDCRYLDLFIFLTKLWKILEFSNLFLKNFHFQEKKIFFLAPSGSRATYKNEK
jgi:hypothetical protein